MRYLDELLALLPASPEVLELGSGAGVDSTRILAERARLTGVDISEAQVALARERVPEATFVCADMTELEFEPESFDAVVAFYALLHVPRAALRPLLDRVATWLRPGGVLLANTLVRSEGEGVQDDWLGVQMFFSGSDPDADRQLARDAGLTLLRDEIVSQHEPEGELSFLRLLAQKPKAT